MWPRCYPFPLSHLRHATLISLLRPAVGITIIGCAYTRLTSLFIPFFFAKNTENINSVIFIELQLYLRTSPHPLSCLHQIKTISFSRSCKIRCRDLHPEPLEGTSIRLAFFMPAPAYTQIMVGWVGEPKGSPDSLMAGSANPAQLTTLKICTFWW